MTYDDQPADRVINDAAEDPRLINEQKKKKAGSHRYDDALNRLGEEGESLVLCAQRGENKWKKFGGQPVGHIAFYEPAVMHNCMKMRSNAISLNG